MDQNREKIWFLRAESSTTKFQCNITDNLPYFSFKFEILTESQTFSPDWPELDFIRTE